MYAARTMNAANYHAVKERKFTPARACYLLDPNRGDWGGGELWLNTNIFLFLNNSNVYILLIISLLFPTTLCTSSSESTGSYSTEV